MQLVFHRRRAKGCNKKRNLGCWVRTEKAADRHQLLVGSRLNFQWCGPRSALVKTPTKEDHYLQQEIKNIGNAPRPRMPPWFQGVRQDTFSCRHGDGEPMSRNHDGWWPGGPLSYAPEASVLESMCRTLQPLIISAGLAMHFEGAVALQGPLGLKSARERRCSGTSGRINNVVN
ncbi:predicted protein [Coccidioides posadasii str. Silveira]|uniref:Predicted protein n=2 Tax=Coccidioides posadasii TaxID=199306 RepID=E9D4I1_COCPS|nr:predicted protein [Coccidioides posadasii str. Silveira]KMM71316.1 hypothetical protein CPAG_07623 [Coccidioides posadasii RMSCC 3488]